jgi:hypothetical protein
MIANTKKYKLPKTENVRMEFISYSTTHRDLQGQVHSLSWLPLFFLFIVADKSYWITPHLMIDNKNRMKK